MTIGTPDSARIARHTSMPLMPGSIRSSRTMSGRLSRNAASARSPSATNDGESLAAQHDAEHLGQRGIVVDHQYPGSHVSCSHFETCRSRGTRLISRLSGPSDKRVTTGRGRRFMRSKHVKKGVKPRLQVPQPWRGRWAWGGSTTRCSTCETSGAAWGYTGTCSAFEVVQETGDRGVPARGRLRQRTRPRSFRHPGQRAGSAGGLNIGLNHLGVVRAGRFPSWPGVSLGRANAYEAAVRPGRDWLALAAPSRPCTWSPKSPCTAKDTGRDRS